MTANLAVDTGTVSTATNSVGVVFVLAVVFIIWASTSKAGRTLAKKALAWNKKRRATKKREAKKAETQAAREAKKAEADAKKSGGGTEAATATATAVTAPSGSRLWRGTKATGRGIKASYRGLDNGTTRFRNWAHPKVAGWLRASADKASQSGRGGIRRRLADAFAGIKVPTPGDAQRDALIERQHSDLRQADDDIAQITAGLAKSADPAADREGLRQAQIKADIARRNLRDLGVSAPDPPKATAPATPNPPSAPAAPAAPTPTAPPTSVGPTSNVTQLHPIRTGGMTVTTLVDRINGIKKQVEDLANEGVEDMDDAGFVEVCAAQARLGLALSEFPSDLSEQLRKRNMDRRVCLQLAEAGAGGASYAEAHLAVAGTYTVLYQPDRERAGMNVDQIDANGAPNGSNWFGNTA